MNIPVPEYKFNPAPTVRGISTPARSDTLRAPMVGPNLRTFLETPDPAAGDDAPGGPPARGRSPGVWILALANLALAGAALYALRVVSGAQEYASRNSADIGSELEAALAGLFAMRIGCYVLAAGFAA